MNLYQLRDMQLAAMTPLRFWTWASMQAFDNPLLSGIHNNLTKNITAEMSFIEKNACLHNKPSFNIKHSKFRGTNLNINEKNITSHPFCNLIHFERTSENESIKERMEKDPKVLIVPPLSGHFASILRDTIESMIPSHNVFITDWVDAKQIPVFCGNFNLEDQITYLMGLVRSLGPDLHILAVTQASYAVLAAVALLAAEKNPTCPRSMTLMGGPIDTRKVFVQLRENVKEKSIDWFRKTQIQPVPPYYFGAFRPVYPGFLQLQNRMELVLNNKSTEIVKYFQHLVRGDEETEEAHKSLYDEFLSVMDVPAELYLQFIESAYGNCALATGEMTCHGKKVDLTAIKKTALLTIEAELDDLSPPGQTRAAHQLCTGIPAPMKRAHLEIGVGHYGIFSGHKWRGNIQPVVHQFIRTHAQSVDETKY